jgi:6-hydroxytryprostatin B O-methyltransferase
MILHDWPSHIAINILKNQLDALKANPRARLIIMDTILPTPGSTSSVEEALLRMRDLTMIQAFNSREREVGEFIDLFSQASDPDGYLILRKTIKPPGSAMSVMEVVYQPSCR